MSIHDIIEGKREWRAHVARVKTLPADYRIVYGEIQRYLFKVGPVSLTEGTLLSDIVDFFEEGALAGKGVREWIGDDVAAFADGLVGDGPTWADRLSPIGTTSRPAAGQDSAGR